MAVNVGIVGSAFDLKEDEIKIAIALGKILAGKTTNIFICYDEKSLPMEAGKAILNKKKVNCFVTNKDEEKKAKNFGFEVINVNLERMFREIVFIKKIDTLIVCGGGSGTLMEVTFAYQLNKKIFILNEVGGTADIFKDKFLDKRKRIKIKSINLKDIDEVIG